jgi:hypothetical protein
MAQGQRHYWGSSREWIVGTISTGLFLIVAGAIFINTPALFDEIVAFFRDFKAVQVGNSSIYLPAPALPENHTLVYSAAMLFSLVWGITQIGILVLRFALHSPAKKKAETTGNIFYSLASYYAIQQLLIEETKWFEFWAVIIMIIGASLIVRAIFLGVAGRNDHNYT